MFKVNYKSFRTYFAPFSGASIVDFEQLNVSWAHHTLIYEKEKRKKDYTTLESEVKQPTCFKAKIIIC